MNQVMNIGENVPSGIGLFIPPLHEIVISTICLSIIVFFVIKIAVPKFYLILDKRHDNIEKKVDDANKLFEEATLIKTQNETEYQKMNDMKKQIQTDARQNANEIMKSAEEKANAEYGQIIKNANEKIQSDKKKALGEAEEYAKEKSVILAKKLLSNALSDKKVADKVFEKMLEN